MLKISLAPQIKAFSGGLYRSLKPIANAYANLTGHRQHGLKYDDLIIEEREDVQKVSDPILYRQRKWTPWTAFKEVCGARSRWESGRDIDGCCRCVPWDDAESTGTEPNVQSRGIRSCIPIPSCDSTIYPASRFAKGGTAPRIRGEPRALPSLPLRFNFSPAESLRGTGKGSS